MDKVREVVDGDAETSSRETLNVNSMTSIKERHPHETGHQVLKRSNPREGGQTQEENQTYHY
jgi:hypothetical protein